MIRIAILGANGGIGKYLLSKLSDEYRVTAVTRNTVDLTDSAAVKKFFLTNYFDVVINTACNSNTSLDTFNEKSLSDNLIIFLNLISCQRFFGKLINIGSGAEFDRRFDINLAEESTVKNVKPIDHYGLSKNLCSRLVLDISNFYTLRLFGAFHKDEPSTRLFPRIKNKEELIITDREFDYFFLDDMVTVLKQEYLTNKEVKHKDMNLVYKNKTTLSYIVNKFCLVNNINTDRIKFVNDITVKNYTGNGDKLYNLSLPLVGLEKGLETYK